MPKTCDKLPDLLATGMAMPFPVLRRRPFSVTELM